MLSQRKFFILVGLVLLTIPAGAGPIVDLLSTGSQQFGQMDLATGVFSAIAPIPATIQYLVPASNGSLLTMSFDGNLDTINRTTGAVSVIGPTGFADCTTPTTPTCGPNSQLTLGSAGGTIYATDFVNNLYTVNPNTGKATLIGSTGIPAVPFIPASTNPDGSFNFYDENIFGLGGKVYANFDAATFDPATSVTTTVIADALYQIDPSTGHATKVAPTDLGLDTILSLNGTVYGFSGTTNQVVTLDLTNGATSIVSDIDPAAGLVGGAAPASIPEPSSVAFVGIGLIAVVDRRHCKRNASLKSIGCNRRELFPAANSAQRG